MIRFILEIPKSGLLNGLKELFIQTPVFDLHIDNSSFELLAWGDPIKGEFFNKSLFEKLYPENIYKNLYGNYYFLYHNKQNSEIIAGNSLFNILPVYYAQTSKNLILSDNALVIGKHIKANKLSRRFLLETILFNYPLFNSGIIDGILLLPSNSFIKISDNKINIQKHTHIENFFPASLNSWRKDVNEMSDVFLESVKKYLPEENYFTTLTGGLDSRTLVSAGLFNGKKFSTYCFGSNVSKDLIIAKKLASNTKLSFLEISLDEKYVVNQSKNCGLEFIRNASGNASFARAHYLYATKILARETEHIITGNFGSEIFRAVHIPGVILAPNLIALFSNEGLDKTIDFIENSMEFNYLNKDSFKNEWEQLKEKIKLLPCFNSGYKELTQNQKFYVFVFEEVFRKYFGAEMVNQFMYVKNRTPFLDIDFLKAIFKTKLAGIHSDFFEHNPFKRIKGQMLYSHIIKTAYPAFGKYITDKGYRPDDLLNFTGKLNILRGYLKKRIFIPDKGFDPYRVNQAYEINRKFYSKIPVNRELFNYEKLTNELYSNPNEILFKIISLSYLQNLLKK